MRLIICYIFDLTCLAYIIMLQSGRTYWKEFVILACHSLLSVFFFADMYYKIKNFSSSSRYVPDTFWQTQTVKNEKNKRTTYTSFRKAHGLSEKPWQWSHLHCYGNGDGVSALNVSRVRYKSEYRVRFSCVYLICASSERTPFATHLY